MSFTPTTPYADEDYGDDYFAERLNVDSWDEADSADKVKALKMATNAIDRLNFTGCKADADQARQFPRGDDTEVPEDVQKACCELALAFLDDVDANLEIENLSYTRQHLGDARVERDTELTQEHLRWGIPSIQAWLLLKPYMRNGGSFDVARG